MTQPTLDAALGYVRRGFAIVPIPHGKKAPVIDDWQDLRLTENDLPEHFSNGANIGILTGHPSGNLLDVDLDAPEAIAAADYFLPVTALVHGRPSKLRSHRWYRVSQKLSYQKFSDPRRKKDGTLVELRQDGHQTLAPPSKATGEVRAWDQEGEPAPVDGAELCRAIARVAAGALIGRYWPANGRRHDARLALGGALARAGWPEEEVCAFVRAVVQIAQPGDREACEKVAGDTRSAFAKLQRDEPVTGLPRLAELVGDDVTAAVARWLGLKEMRAASIGDGIILPGGTVTIRAAAKALFARIGPTETLFIRGGAVMSIAENKGTLGLKVLGPIAARSRFERYAKFWVWRIGRDGTAVLKPAIIPQDMAAALLESEEASTLLPNITGLVGCPILVSTNGSAEIIGPGYHSVTGLFITGGQLPPQIEFSEAIKALQELVSEFDFQSPGDRSRALASFITPALKLGGHLQGSVPADVAEADQSQSGKTYRQRLVAAVYNERPSLVTCRSGGVGSVDESLNEQLIIGRPFIQLDNFRGNFDSPHIEALLTAERSFPVRVPHCREIIIDPSRFFVMLTSNGVETTRDFANRGSIVRNRKRDGYRFRRYPEGDLLQHIRARQAYYLGAVFTIIQTWVELGCPRSDENRHDFREWAQTLDCIVQNLLDEAPLMDGHQAAQLRASNPGLTFLRKLALAVAAQDQLGRSLIASTLYEISDSAGVAIPGLHEPNEAKGKLLIGAIMARLFKADDCLTVDEFVITRRETETARLGGGTYIAKAYEFGETVQ